MPRHVTQPTIVAAAGNKPKTIAELVGRLNTGDEQVSVARMSSPEGWVEPGQRPAFREITVVIAGTLRVESEEGAIEDGAGEAVISDPAQRARESSWTATGGYLSEMASGNKTSPCNSITRRPRAPISRTTALRMPRSAATSCYWAWDTSCLRWT